MKADALLVQLDAMLERGDNWPRMGMNKQLQFVLDRLRWVGRTPLVKITPNLSKK
jgi:hypothetical protein